MLDNEGVWNVAQVLAIKTSSSVCVRYDGWGAAYDEDIDLSTGRIAPYHTYTWTVKCWAKYLNWPWWPCVVSIAWLGRCQWGGSTGWLSNPFLCRQPYARQATRPVSRICAPRPSSTAISWTRRSRIGASGASIGLIHQCGK